VISDALCHLCLDRSEAQLALSRNRPDKGRLGVLAQIPEHLPHVRPILDQFPETFYGFFIPAVSCPDQGLKIGSGLHSLGQFKRFLGHAFSSIRFSDGNESRRKAAPQTPVVTLRGSPASTGS
jgi:hypothetical protein